MGAEADYLTPAVEQSRDHVLGPGNAPITLVEYGSYANESCSAVDDVIAKLRDRFDDQMRYVFRHRPLPGNDLAWRAAELAEQADRDQFWKVHVDLMSRSDALTEGDLDRVAASAGIDPSEESKDAHQRVDDDEQSAKASGVELTPTFFINGRRYKGPWDESSLSDAMLDKMGHRVRVAAFQFVRWGPSAGVLLLVATLLALALSNSPLGPAFADFWEWRLGIALGGWSFSMSLLAWVNDGLLTIFFLVVGLEIKREFTVGHLADRRSAALPIAAAIGGMVAPALLYLSIISPGQWQHGWGVPIATDTAFAIAVMAAMGRRVPLELRVFLTAAAIVDDIGSILVVAFFYSSGFQIGYLIAAVAAVIALGFLHRSHIYRVTPYVIVGILLWAFVHAGGLHATLAGVLLALFIPTRPPPNLPALTMQANSILRRETSRGDEVLHHGPSLPALRALDTIHNRLESPADRLLRHAGARSSYVVLPIFALANAGVALNADVLAGHGELMVAIMAGLVVGKPLGLFTASALAVRVGIAQKPDTYSWRQLAGAGILAGIGFTMSLFIAGQAFPLYRDFEAAKIAVLSASVVAGIAGALLLWSAQSPSQE